MGSRIKENPQKIFDLFFEAACSTTEDDDPQVLRQFPREFDDQESIQMLPRFCFPFDIERMKESPTVQHFTFALTDMEGKQRFGFCRLAVGLHSCLCILSYLPWFEVFYKILNYIADNLVKGQFTQLDEFLSALHAHPVPNLGSPISLEFDPKVTRLTISTEQHMNRQDGSQHLKPGTASAYFIAPDQGKLPTIPENRNLTEFVVAVDVNNMLQLYASLLHERRIVLTSSKLSTLTACVQASSSMLYPMHWQHIYIPALPSHLLDYCCAPMPYLIGVHTSLMERVRSKSLEDVVILNIDSNTMESPFQDLENLPSDVVSLLKFQLKKQSATTGDGVARAFLRAQALLFGGYREALMFSPGKPIFFSQENFLHQGSSAMQAFLQRAVHLQLFKEFIEDRLERLNAGEDVSDLFEQEINRSLSPGSLHAYQLWVENLKKGGGALLTSVKNKANPAVRSVYQYAKGHAKMGLKHMRSHLMEKESSVDQHRNRVYSMNCDHISSPIMPNRSKQSETLQNRLPITQHFGKSRPRRPQRENSRTELEAERDDSTSSSMASLDCCSEPEDGENLHASFLDPGGLDLLGEIFETLNFLEPSQTGQPLYSTRSLDFCNLEERNFYTKLRTSRDTLYEPLSEEQDAGDPFPEDKMSLSSLDQEYRPRALPLAATTGVDQDNEMHDCDIMEPQEIGCPKKATVPLLQQEEEKEEEKEDEEVATPASCEQSQVSWTLQVDPETSVLAATSTRVASGEETGIVQVDGFPTATRAEPPATGCSSTPSPVPPSFQLKVNGNPTAMPKKSVPVLGQASTSQSRAMSLSRVSELKKRFEA